MPSPSRLKIEPFLSYTTAPRHEHVLGIGWYFVEAVTTDNSPPRQRAGNEIEEAFAAPHFATLYLLH